MLRQYRRLAFIGMGYHDEESYREFSRKAAYKEVMYEREKRLTLGIRCILFIIASILFFGFTLGFSHQRLCEKKLGITERRVKPKNRIMIGVVIPPGAICVFVVKNISKVPMGVIYKGVAPFLISLILVWAMLFFFPGLVLWLPLVFYK